MGLFFSSCEKEDDPIITLPPRTEVWKPFQLAKLPVKNLPQNQDSFTGVMGDFEITLGRIPGDTLIFIIPPIPTSSAKLEVTISNQLVIWDLKVLIPDVYPKSGGFLKDFNEYIQRLRVKIQEKEELVGYLDKLEAWQNAFIEKTKQLNERELDWITGAILFDFNNRLFINWERYWESVCESAGPKPALMEVSKLLLAQELSILDQYQNLPKNPLHEAVLTSFGLGIWSQFLSLEILSVEIRDCPVLRDYELIDNETGKVLTPDVPIPFTTYNRKELRILGVYQKLNKGVLDPGRQGFEEKKRVIDRFSAILNEYLDNYGYKLPALPNSVIELPENANLEKKQIEDYKWNSPYFENSNIRILEMEKGGPLLSLTLVSENGQPESFDFQPSVLTIPHRIYPAILDIDCPLVVDVILENRTHKVRIENGQEPFEITWSNGGKGESQINLPPGENHVMVVDETGCERVILFPTPEYGTVTDIDGNMYPTVKWKDTWWMAESLRTTRKNDGSDILKAVNISEWTGTNQATYTWWLDHEEYDETFGKLYNYQAVCCDICPEGWRLPTLDDLGIFFELFPLEGARSLRSTTGWPESEGKFNNLSGLAIFPSGGREGQNGKFLTEYPQAIFWSATKFDSTYPFRYFVDEFSNELRVAIEYDLRSGYSIRCVKKVD